MTDIQPGSAVVVGIDGSQAAIHAAQWAIDEAIARDVPLRLTHVARPEAAGSPASDAVPLDIEHAEKLLRQADAVIQATGKAAEVETAIVRGDPTAVLVAESRCGTGLRRLSRHRRNRPKVRGQYGNGAGRRSPLPGGDHP